MAAKKMYINGVEINAKLIPDLTALTAVEVTDTTKKSIPVADEDSPNDEAKRMLLSELKQLINITQYQNLKTKTSDYNLLITDDFIILDSNLSEVNITLPLISSSIHGKMYMFYCLDATEGANIICSGSDTIKNTGGTYVLNVDENLRIIADNSSGYWLIFS